MQQPRADDASYEGFKNRAAGIQSYVLTAAVLVGGGWTLYRYITLDIRQAQQQLFEQAQIDVTITGTQEQLDSGELCIAAIVQITNNGKRNVFLDYGGNPFSVQQVVFNDRDRPFVSNLPHPYPFRVLRTGEAERESFIVRVPHPGIYQVSFMVPLSEAELIEHDKIAERAKAPPRNNAKIYWVGSAFVNVHRHGATR